MRDVAVFVGRLRERKAIASLALEFCILTAARSGEVLGACWSEIDFAAKVWTIPACRMKAGREHRIPLSDRARQSSKSFQRRGLAILSLPANGAASRFPQWRWK